MSKFFMILCLFSVDAMATSMKFEFKAELLICFTRAGHNECQHSQTQIKTKEVTLDFFNNLRINYPFKLDGRKYNLTGAISYFEDVWRINRLNVMGNIYSKNDDISKEFILNFQPEISSPGQTIYAGFMYFDRREVKNPDTNETTMEDVTITPDFTVSTQRIP